MLARLLCSPFCFPTPFRNGCIYKHYKCQPAKMYLVVTSCPVYRLALLILPRACSVTTVLLNDSALTIRSRHQLPHVNLPKAIIPGLAICLQELNFRLTSGRKIVIPPKEAKDRKIFQCNSKIKSSF